MWVARYPYFQTARLLLLNNLYLLQDIDFGKELRKAALHIADRRLLFNLIEGNFNFSFRENLPAQEPSVDRTLSLIDSFLSTLPEEYRMQENTSDTLTDYVSAYLMRDGTAPKEEKEEEDTTDEDVAVTPRLRGQELIDHFIAAGSERITIQISPDNEAGISGTEERDSVMQQNENEDIVEEDFFTETLARIYIKQKKYTTALEIIRKLYLDYPNKNRYFADQIRFLEKLVTNAKIE